MEGSAGRLERHSLGPTDGCSLGRPSRALSVYQTCHRRIQQWVRPGIMRGVFEALAEDLHNQDRLDVSEAFIDGSFAPAKKGDQRSAKRNVARGRRSWPLADRHALLVAVPVESATPHEVKLAEYNLVQMVIQEAPQNPIGDNAYDSDELDVRLMCYGIELISPRRSNPRNRTQDLRRLNLVGVGSPTTISAIRLDCPYATRAIRPAGGNSLGEFPQSIARRREVSRLILSKSGEPESALQADKTGMGTESVQFRFHLKENETVGAIGIRFFEPIQRFVVPA